MKRLLLILLLFSVAGARADDVSDAYNAGAGYAGSNKGQGTSAAKGTDPASVIVGLGPTHRAVKEMAGTGIDAQTLKSFVLDWQTRSAAGEDVRYDNMLFLIDESSMIGIVTEFFDYECIACSMMAPVMEKVMNANAGVRFAFRDWTIFAARYPESTLASHRGLGIYRKLGEEAYTAYHNGIYRTGHNEGKLTAEDIEKVATAVGAGAASGDDSAASDQMIESNDALAEMLGLTGTPGIIIMPAENATAQNTTVIPGVVSEDVLQQAINRAAGR